jgi:hypothetical protein
LQFLEALLDKGIQGIIRVGGRSRSDRLAALNLRNVAAVPWRNPAKAPPASPQNPAAPIMSLAASRRFYALKDEAREKGGRGHQLMQLLRDMLTAEMVAGHGASLAAAMELEGQHWQKQRWQLALAEQQQWRQRVTEMTQKGGKGKGKGLQKLHEEQQTAEEQKVEAAKQRRQELCTWGTEVLQVIDSFMANSPDCTLTSQAEQVCGHKQGMKRLFGWLWWLSGAPWAVFQAASQGKGSDSQAAAAKSNWQES